MQSLSRLFHKKQYMISPIFVVILLLNSIFFNCGNPPTTAKNVNMTLEIGSEKSGSEDSLLFQINKEIPFEVNLHNFEAVDSVLVLLTVSDSVVVDTIECFYPGEFEREFTGIFHYCRPGAFTVTATAFHEGGKFKDKIVVVIEEDSTNSAPSLTIEPFRRYASAALPCSLKLIIDDEEEWQTYDITVLTPEENSNVIGESLFVWSPTEDDSFDTLEISLVVTDNGKEPKSDTANATITLLEDGKSFPAPRDLRVVKRPTNFVLLEWSDDMCADYYTVYRSPTGEEDTWAEQTVTDTFFYDSTGEVFYYRITSVNLLGESEPSKIVLGKDTEHYGQSISFADTKSEAGETDTSASTVKLVCSEKATEDISVTVSVKHVGTDENDFTLSDSVVVIKKDKNSAALSLDITEDDIPEDNETFIITIDSVSNGFILKPDSHVVTIMDSMTSYLISYYMNTASEEEDPLETDKVNADSASSENVYKIMTETVDEITDDLNNEGYSLTGWNSKKDGSGKELPDEEFEISDNIALYAQWEINNYPVTYKGNGNDAGSPPDSAEYPYDSLVTVQGNSGELVKKGHTFSHWNTKADGSGTSYQPDTTFAIGSSDVTLYAQWSVNRYPVIYFGNGNTDGEEADTMLYSFNAEVTIAGQGDLSNTGHTFTGWNEAADGSGQSYDTGSTNTLSDTLPFKLYAQWSKKRYTVAYHGNGYTSHITTLPDSTTHYYGDKVIVKGPGALSRTGYSFYTWSTDSAGEGIDYDSGATFDMPANKVTLYARWKVKGYQVSYHGNGNTHGLLPSDTIYSFNDQVTVAGIKIAVSEDDTALLAKTGYIFNGWNTDSGGNGIQYPVDTTILMGAGDVVLYAQWNDPDGMILINAKDSSFLMGGSLSTNPDDSTEHQVTFTYDFWMDTTEVIQDKYDVLMEKTYGTDAYENEYSQPTWNFGQDDKYPVYNINWYDAVLYCNAHTRETGSDDTVYSYTSIEGTPGNGCYLNDLIINFESDGFRLPTEAEWEYAYRGGTATTYYWGKDLSPYPANAADTTEIDEHVVWINNAESTQEVAQKIKNPFGLYDMSGNVYEWCNDWFGPYSAGNQTDPTGPESGTERVIRGGCWGNPTGNITSYYRSSSPVPETSTNCIGFRVCLPIKDD